MCFGENVCEEHKEGVRRHAGDKKDGVKNEKSVKSAGKRRSRRAERWRGSGESERGRKEE